MNALDNFLTTPTSILGKGEKDIIDNYKELDTSAFENFTEAKISLSEKIKNNYEIITEMKIQKVEL